MSARHFIRWSLFSLSLIGVLCESEFALASTESGTLTPATKIQVCPPFPFDTSFTFVGFTNGGFGTYSPTGLAGGRTVWVVTDEQMGDCGVSQSMFFVSGFSSDPGSTWLTSVTCNGVENLASNARFYQFTTSGSTGVAQWYWDRQFGLTNGSQVSCTIVHN